MGWKELVCRRDPVPCGEGTGVMGDLPPLTAQQTLRAHRLQATLMRQRGTLPGLELFPPFPEPA